MAITRTLYGSFYRTELVNAGADSIRVWALHPTDNTATASADIDYTPKCSYCWLGQAHTLAVHDGFLA